MRWSKIVLSCLVLLLLWTITIFFRKKKYGKKRIKREPLLNDRYADVLEENINERLSIENDLVKEKVTSALSSEADMSLADAETKDSEIIALTLMAKSKDYYSGYELLQVLLSFGFHFGEMNIFHKHKNEDGTGPILFSLAQAVAPGSFDLDDVGAIKCPGLALFMELNETPNALARFEKMLDIAKQLTEELGGDLFDEKKCPLDQARIDSLRAKIDVWVHRQEKTGK